MRVLFCVVGLAKVYDFLEELARCLGVAGKIVSPILKFSWKVPGKVYGYFKPEKPLIIDGEEIEPPAGK
jgi:hypothetical protein